MNKILDEFTDLPVSRERKRQLRRNKQGLCKVSRCASAPAKCGMCRACYTALIAGQITKYHAIHRSQKSEA
jgi:hypothetical protein